MDGVPAGIFSLDRNIASHHVDAGHINAGPVIRRHSHRTVDRPRHIEYGRDADLGHHLVGVLPAELAAHMRVQINDSRQDAIPPGVDNLVSLGPVDVFGDFFDLAAGNRHIITAFQFAARIDDITVFQQQIISTHCFILPLNYNITPVLTLFVKQE